MISCNKDLHFLLLFEAVKKVLIPLNKFIYPKIINLKIIENG